MLKLKKLSISLMTAVMAVSFAPGVQAADAQHYELVGWTADGTGINFSYQGPMGRGLAGLPCGELMYPHAQDPSWTGPDSAAPILAYIKAYGITGDIKESLNPTVFDPTVFQALSAQGVNLSDLGGPNVPPGSLPPSSLMGKAIIKMPEASAHIVGLGIPKPDLSGLLASATPKAVSNPTPTPAPVQSKQPSASTPTPVPNPPIPHETTPSGDTASVESATSTQALIPDSTNTGVSSAGPVVPPKIVPPDLQQQNTQSQAPWKKWLYISIAAVVALGGGAFGFAKWKQRNT